MAGDTGNEVHVGQYPKLSRRDFLKLAGIAAGAAGAAILPGCAPSTENEPLNVRYKTVEDGDSIFLKIVGQDVQTVITYSHEKEILASKLELRLEDGIPSYVPLEDGQTRVRNIGEILDNTLQPLELNTDLLSADQSVHYVTTSGFVMSDKPPWRYPLDASVRKNLCGIKVVTDCVDAIRNGTAPPSETTPLHLSGPETVGEGWAIGHLFEGKFSVMGFIQDARVLRPKV